MDAEIIQEYIKQNNKNKKDTLIIYENNTQDTIKQNQGILIKNNTLQIKNTENKIIKLINTNKIIKIIQKPVYEINMNNMKMK